MSDSYFRVRILERLQRITWYVILGCFLPAVVLEVKGISLAHEIALLGLLLLLLASLLKIFIIAEQFRSAKLYRISLLGYTLLFILLSTVFIKVFITP